MTTELTLDSIQENGDITDSGKYKGQDFIVIDSSADDDVIAAIEDYCKKHNCLYGFSDEYVKDDYDNISIYRWGEDCFRDDEGYIFGINSIQNGDIDFNDVLELFKNNPKKALPYWINKDKLEQEGFKKLSCGFNIGYYEYNNQDDPNEIYNNLKNKYNEIIFQISSSSPFEIYFCVYVK